MYDGCTSIHGFKILKSKQNFEKKIYNWLMKKIYTTNNVNLCLISLCLYSYNFKSFQRVSLVDPEPRNWSSNRGMQRKSDLCSEL